MSKKSAAMFACAVAGVVTGLSSAAKAGTFVDNFNNGSLTNSDSITNFWNVGSITSSGGGATINTNGGTLTEPVGGPSTAAYTGTYNQTGGVYEYSNYNSSPTSVSPNTFNEFNFLKNAETITLTAAPGTSLIPGTDYTSGSSLDAADTILGVDGNTGGFEIGSGNNSRIYLALTNQNTPFFIVKNSSGGTVYSLQKFGLAAPSATELVTSMFIYIDGTQEANDHLYINFGETLQNSAGAVSTYSYQALPFDVGTSGGSGSSKTQGQLDSIKAGLTNGAGLGLELENNTSNLNGNESVSFAQVTDIYTLNYTASGSSSASWFSGVAGINGALTNFNTPAGVAAPFVNGASVTFDGNTSSGGHNTGNVFTINLSLAAGVYPSSTNVSGTSPYTFTGIGGINGIGGLNLLGPSSLTLLTTTNTFSGATNISSGTLIAGATNSLSPNSPVLITGGTLNASGFSNTIPSLNMTSGSLQLGTGTLLTDTGTAAFAGTLKVVGTPVVVGDILMTYVSETGTFASNNLPSGDTLSYSGGMLEIVSAGPSTLTWDNAGGSGDGLTWNTTQKNFNNGTGVVAYSDTSNAALSAGDIVSFTDTNNGNYNVSIPSVVHPTSTTVNNSSGTYTFNGSGGIAGPGSLTKIGTAALTLDTVNTYTGGTNVSGGTVNLAIAGALPSGTNLTIGSGATVFTNNLGTTTPVTVGSLSIAGKLDLNNNALIVHNSSIGAVTALVASGYNSGAWNGTTGIVSTAAAGDTSHLTTLGVIVNDNGSRTPLYGSGGTIASTFEGSPSVDGDVLVKYTYYGDANLNGAVDGSDYSLIDNGYLNGLTGWYNGDFNYDNVVNGSDYTLIDNAFNSQGTAIAALIASPDAIATDQIAGSGATSAVPEPTTLGLLGIGAVGLLGRRNRRRN